MSAPLKLGALVSAAQLAAMITEAGPADAPAALELRARVKGLAAVQITEGLLELLETLRSQAAPSSAEPTTEAAPATAKPVRPLPGGLIPVADVHRMINAAAPHGGALADELRSDIAGLAAVRAGPDLDAKIARLRHFARVVDDGQHFPPIDALKAPAPAVVAPPVHVLDLAGVDYHRAHAQLSRLLGAHPVADVLALLEALD